MSGFVGIMDEEGVQEGKIIKDYFIKELIFELNLKSFLEVGQLLQGRKKA